MSVALDVWTRVPRVKKYFCQCVLEDGAEIFLAIRAETEAEASRKAHEGYQIEYVLDILTPLQMEYRKRHLKPSMLSVQQLQ